MNVISQDAFAKIAVNKSLLKEYSSSKYSRVVYLNDGDEFQIQLFNPEQFIIAAKIYLNNEALSDMLVLRPGERIWLERYLDKSRKFMFSTYEVDDSPEVERATAHNGEVKVEFYKVKTKRENPILFVSTPKTYEPISVYYNHALDTGGNNVYSQANCSITGQIKSPSFSQESLSLSAASMDSCSDDITYSTSYSASSAKTIKPSSVETGRVEEGGYSSQKFSYVDYDFENWPYKTDTIFILPISRKPVTSSDLKKRYCSNCGRKLSPKHKFCPYCGNKVD